MSVTAASGPFITYGNPLPQGTETGVQYNPDAGCGFDFALSGQLDNSFGYQPGQGPSVPIYGWAGSPIYTIEQAPSTKATANIATLANVVNGTPMTLVSSTAAGITVGQNVTSRGNGQIINNLWAIDSDVNYITFGTNAAISVYDPRTGAGRAISITGVASGTGGDFLVNGYDYVGFPMTEKITAAAGAATTNGKKAFKYIYNVVPQFTDAHNYSVGTADIFGLPLRFDNKAQIEVVWAGAQDAGSTGTYAVAVTTTATSTTGDVRGTYAPGSAANGTNVLAAYQTTPAYNMPNLSASIGAYAGLIGVSQYYVASGTFG